MIRKLRNYFFAGLAVLIPVALTVFIIYTLFEKVDNLMRAAVAKILMERFGVTYVTGFGFVAGVILIILTGLLARNYIGRKIIQVGDTIVARIPLISKIYLAIQQIMQALFSEKGEVFKKAVLIQYPRRGIYSIGFFTQDTKGVVQNALDVDVVSIFLPTTPNPTSGFLLFVPKEDTIDVNLSVEEALKLVISGGAIVPEEKKPEKALSELEKQVYNSSHKRNKKHEGGVIKTAKEKKERTKAS